MNPAIHSTELIIAVDIDAGWWTYRVHFDGTVFGKCPEEDNWCKVHENDLGNEDAVTYDELIAAAEVEFKQAGLR